MSAIVGEVTVFAVYTSDCRYEGGRVDAVFSSRDKALAHCLALVEDEKDQDEYDRRWDLAQGNEPRVSVWEREDEERWSDGMAVVGVVAFTLDDPTLPAKLAEKKADRWTESPEDAAKWLSDEVSNG